MPRDATPSRRHQHAWADQVYILPESDSGARRPYGAPASVLPGRRKGPRGLSARRRVVPSAMTTIATYHVRMVNGRATASGEKSSEALASWCATMSQFWLFPRTRGLGAVERNSFRFFPAGRFARSNGTNGTEKRTVLGELHRGLSYLMTGKGAWVAGADRREAPGPKLEHLGRRLRLRHQPPRSWQLLNGGDQRGVAKNGMNSVLPRSNLAGARQLVRNHEQTGAVAPSENGRLPPVLAHQLARAQKSLICPKRSPGSVTY